ncbi:MAG TPA: rRNA maturation RNase YbeY [Alkalispirochaeta sp.]|nr:rRNA maturation RNase YbeY [Alkalispirochaeta sp.]
MTSDSSANRVDISSENLEPPSWTGNLRRYASAVLRELSITYWEVSILLTDDERMRELNATYRSIDEPTDVLSFSTTPDGDSMTIGDGAFRCAGDIVINVPMIERQAKEWYATPEEELRRMMVHGLLHLAGHTHQSNDFAEEPMLRLQEAILDTVEERIY